MKLTCPKSSQSCQTGDYQIKVINKLPSPSDIIARQVLKTTIFDKLTTFAFPLLCAIGWLLIVWAILFN